MGFKGNLTSYLVKSRKWKQKVLTLNSLKELEGVSIVGIDVNNQLYKCCFDAKYDDYLYLYRFYTKVQLLIDAGIKVVVAFDGQGPTKAKYRESIKRQSQSKLKHEQLEQAQLKYQDIIVALSSITPPIINDNINTNEDKKTEQNEINDIYSLNNIDQTLLEQKQEQEFVIDQCDRNIVKITSEMKQRVKDLLDAMGILHFTANSSDNFEADHILASLPVDAVLTEDRDLICHGVPMIITQLLPARDPYTSNISNNNPSNYRGNRKRKRSTNNDGDQGGTADGAVDIYADIDTTQPHCQIIKSQDLFDKLAFDNKDCPFTRQHLIDLFIMAGCDYSDGIPKIGVANAWKLLNQQNQQTSSLSLYSSAKDREQKWNMLFQHLTTKQSMSFINRQQFIENAEEAYQEFHKKWTTEMLNSPTNNNDNQTTIINSTTNEYAKSRLMECILNCEKTRNDDVIQSIIKPPSNSKLVYSRDEITGLKTYKRIRTSYNYHSKQSYDVSNGVLLD